jgi:hypothetical protein
VRSVRLGKADGRRGRELAAIKGGFVVGLARGESEGKGRVGWNLEIALGMKT